MAFESAEIVRHIERLSRFSLRLCRNPDRADDLLQATLLHALERRTAFEEGTDLFSWTSRIMFTLFVTHYRQRMRFEARCDPEDTLNMIPESPHQDSAVAWNRMGEAFGRLAPEHRQVLYLVCVQGYTYEDVAQTLCIPVGTVRSRLFRAREKLKNLLMEHGRERIVTRNVNQNAQALAQ